MLDEPKSWTADVLILPTTIYTAPYILRVTVSFISHLCLTDCLYPQGRVRGLPWWLPIQVLQVCLLLNGTSALFRSFVPRIVEVENMRFVKNDL